ncbi:MAG: hypothetical protein AABX70_03730 [Nanoarchaeota archaeon]
MPENKWAELRRALIQKLRKEGVREGMPFNAEIALAKYLESKLMHAAKIYQPSLTQGKKCRFLDCLRIVWNSYTANTFFVDDPLIQKVYPEVCKPITFHMEAEIDRVQAWVESHDAYLGMHICIGILEQATTDEDFRKNLVAIISRVYHECDHIYFPSHTAEIDTIKKRMLYQMDEAEIRAFSKQIAYLYFSILPGKPFSYDTFKDYIIKHCSADKEYYLIQFLEFFKNPSETPFKKREAIEFAEEVTMGQHPEFTKDTLSRTFRLYMQYITLFVAYLNQTKEIEDAGEVPDYMKEVL